MRILFDNNVPKALRRSLEGHTVQTAYQMGWAHLQNGLLLAAAQRAKFDLLITADQNLEYQQNQNDRLIALVVLGSAQWPYVRPYRHLVIEAAEAARPGSYAFVDIPLPPKPRRSAS